MDEQSLTPKSDAIIAMCKKRGIKIVTLHREELPDLSPIPYPAPENHGTVLFLDEYRGMIADKKE